MEKLINNIANKVALELKLDNDNKEIIAYGMFAVIQIGLTIIFVTIFGIIFNVVIEALVICFAGSTLRKYSGGVHASTPSSCTFMSTIICVGLAMLFSYFVNPFINLKLILCLGLIIFIWSYYLIYKLAPVDSAAKPIKKQEKKIRMKRGSIFVLSCYIIITIINIGIYVHLTDKRFLLYSLCLYGGTSWQVFTLTKVGHSTINKLDSLLNQILIIKRRELR